VAGYSNYVDNKVLEHVTGKTTFAAVTPFIALLTTNPSNNTGTGLVETTYTNYARVACSGATWATAASGSITTASVVSFPSCGTTGATIVGWALYDASTAGNLLFYGTCSLTVSSGIQPQFAAGALTITLA
jgi:hypothetical protein